MTHIWKSVFNLGLWAMMLALFLSPVISAGCASRSLKPLNSFVADDYPATAVTTLADQTTLTLAAKYPPGHTIIYLNQSDNPKDELGVALEQALRAKGFSVVPENNENALTVAYVLDRIDEELWYLRLTVSDGLSIARTYRITENTVEMGAATMTGLVERANGQR